MSEMNVQATNPITASATGFSGFKRAVTAQFDRMQKHDLFTVNVDGDTLWTTYLASFPPGTNPEFRKRTEHDCSCCRSFVKRAGKVVAIIDGRVESVWDIRLPADACYQAVAEVMAALVKATPIDNVFLTTERTAGTDKNFEDVEGKHVRTWEHFFVKLPDKCVEKAIYIGPKGSTSRATHDVMLRSLTELTPESVDAVLELIAQSSLYRGEEHKFALEAFAKLQAEASTARGASDRSLDLFVWSRIGSTPPSVARIRNTAIGTLLIDLSNGKEIDEAVKAFEVVVAPANYKRPTALVTKAMVEKAKATIESLGLTSALERRYANLSDVSVNNVLFADRDAKKALTGDVFSEIGGTVKDKSFKRVEEIPIEKFLTDVLPKATSVEVMLENRHGPNLVSLIAPADPTAGLLFKWPNRFCWSYNGDMADSIKERVKAAGGNVTGELCCRLAWDYTDDLDFHMHEPGGGGNLYHINYATYRRRPSPSGGTLDLDANGADGPRPDPCENIYYDRLATMKEGTYELKVNNYRRRSDGAGFTVEIDILGTVHRIAYNKALRQGETVDVATLKYTRAGGVEIVKSLPTTQAVKKVWGLNTQNFHRVSAIMLSPNFWDCGHVGNKHFFFMMDGCVNDGRARSFFNEFLKEELTPHRKVIEIVGSKMRAEQTAQQLSGIGFSSTQRNELVCRIGGAFSRVVRLLF